MLSSLNEFIVSSSVEYQSIFIRKKENIFLSNCNKYDAGLNCAKVNVLWLSCVISKRERIKSKE